MQPKHLFLTITVFFSCLCPIFAQQPIILTHGGTVRTVDFSPVNASIFASAGENNLIKLWNLQDDTVTTFSGHTGPINAVAFSPNGQLLASGSDDWTFRLWNIPQQQHIATSEHIIDRNRSQVKDVVFSPDGQSLASAGYLGVKLWNTNNQAEITTLHHDNWVLTIAFSPNGQRLAAGDSEGIVKVWDIQKRQVITQLEGDTTSVYSVQFSPDGQTLTGAGYDGKIKLWNVPNWERLGTLENNSTVHTLDFSPDGKVLASTGHSAVTLWSVNSGKKIAALTGHTDWVLGTAFSPDSTTLISSSNDGTVRFENVETYLQMPQQPETVQLIYFRPRNRLPQTDTDTKLEALIKDVQQFYADQMQNRGFGRKTFTFETDPTGRAVVHYVNGRFIDQYYYTETTNKIMEEINEEFDTSKNIYLIAADVGSEVIEGENSCGGVGGGGWETRKGRTDQRNPGGWAIIPASGMCFSLNIAAHELGHAFGLEHDFRSDAYIMSYGTNPNQFSNCATEWLDAHRYFNANQTAFNEPTTIEMLTAFARPPNTTHFRFEVGDADGLHQAQLLIPTASVDPAPGTKLHSCKSLNSKTHLIEFTTPEVTSRNATEVKLQVIDTHGNITRQTYPVEVDEIVNGDVNGDGIVNIQDLVLVASNFGKTGRNPTDVNKDGTVNIQDLVLVAGAVR